MPFPPLGGLLVPEPWPLIPDEQGFWLGELHPAAGTRLRWEDIDPHVDQRTIILTRRIRLTAVTPRRATSLANWLASVKSAKTSQRQKLIEAFWRRTFNLRAARAHVRQYRIAANALRWLCSLVFVLCFLWLPFVYGWFGEEDWRLPAGAVVLMLCTALIALAWRRLDKRLVPQDTSGRWLGFLHHFLMPQHAMRALDHLSVELLSDLHPLAVAKVLLPTEDLQILAAETWRHWRYRSPTDPLHEAGHTVIPRIEAACQAWDLPIGQLEEPPPRDSDAQAYCPRCHTSFTAGASSCDECGGVALVPWN